MMKATSSLLMGTILVLEDGAAVKRCTINAAMFAINSGPERATFGAVRWRGGPGRVYGTWEIWGEDTTISN